MGKRVAVAVFAIGVTLGGCGQGDPRTPEPPVVVDRIGRELMVTLSAEDCHRVMDPLVAPGAKYEGYSFSCFTP